MGKLPSYIICLLIDYFKGQLCPSDDTRLQTWLKKHPKQQKEVKELQHIYQESLEALQYNNIDISQAWQKVDRRTARIPKWRRKLILQRCEIAAGILLPILLGAFLFHRLSPSMPQPPITVTDVIRETSHPSTQVLLELSNGEQIILDKSVNRKIQSTEGIIVGIDSTNTIAIIHTKDSVIASEKPNRIYVPIGGEYNIILCDGTKVWVNSDSRLSFPDHFHGPERMVELNGEAYFEVSKNGKPFIVNTGNSSIRVLGTAFNVCSYSDEQAEQITLVNGAVKVKVGEKNYPLRPGQQLTSLKSSAQVNIRKVNTELYTSWRNNLFRFVDMSLEDITTKLKRWYNVRFTFQEEVCREYRFTGAAHKENDLVKLIERIQTSNPHIQFKIKDHEIIISKK